MLRITFAAMLIALPAAAQGFSFTIGSPVASQDFQFKSAPFVFRTEGCADSAKLQISASAEGIVKGARRSVTLKVSPGSKPGIYGVNQTWPAEGQWVVILKGACSALTTSAIVPIGPKGFIRESSKFFSRAATEGEIEASLRTLSQGGNQ